MSLQDCRLGSPSYTDRSLSPVLWTMSTLMWALDRYVTHAIKYSMIISAWEVMQCSCFSPPFPLPAACLDRQMEA